MAAPRTDAPKAEETGDSSAPPPASASAPKLAQWMPLLCSIALMPVLAYAVTTFILLPKLQKGLGITPVAATTKEAEGESKEAGTNHSTTASGDSENVPMTKLLVNVSGTMGSRYLLTSLTLVGKGGLKEEVAKHDAQLRDVACGLLSTKTITDIEKPGARNLIRSELISGFNHILGNGSIQEIFLTEFAIQ